MEPPQQSLSLPWRTRIALFVFSTVTDVSCRKKGMVNRRLLTLLDFRSPSTPPYDAVCRRFARKVSAVVIFVNYRLAPEHRYPSQHDDCFDVLKFLNDGKNRCKSLPENANVLRCFLAGDSAGGNLAHHVAQRACEFNFR